MLPATKRTAHDWFNEAARCYVEGHQACAWCGGKHRVFKAVRGERLEYYCKDCDFYVCQDTSSGTYCTEPGRLDLTASSDCLDHLLLHVES